MEQPELAIQFVNYKTKDYLKQSIADVKTDLRGAEIDYMIYVLENGSGDDLSELEQEQVHIQTSPANLGFGAGHNVLASVHESRYMLILNPDIKIIEEATIARLKQSLEQIDQAGIVGPRLVTKQLKQQEWDHGELDFSYGNDSPTSFWEARKKRGAVAWVSGAAMLIETEAFRAAEGFDENFFLYKEEEDLCLRLRQLGYQTYYEPDVTILHHGSVVAHKANRYFARSIRYYKKKHLK